MPLIANLKQRARQLKAETLALYMAARHPATPWYAKLLVAGIVAYALSPIDLIPDFIPVLGLLDDIVLLPLAITVAIRLVPEHVMGECRIRARDAIHQGKPVSRVAGIVIVLLWAAIAVLGIAWLANAARH